MLFSKVLAPSAILLAGVSAQSQSTESEEMRILPITTGTLAPVVPFPSVSDTGVMSIPRGETPISTSSTFGTITSGSVTGTATSGSRSSVPTTSSSTAAAPAVFVAGDGMSGVFAMAMSGISMALGFAWTLL